MLETGATGAAQSQAAATDSGNTVKRYAPPNQRNRLNRRKSAEKNQVFASRNTPIGDYGDAVGSSNQSENTRPGLIPFEGCADNPELLKFMKDRWNAAMASVNDLSLDPSDRAVVVCTDKAPSAWGGQIRPPHQMMSPTGGASSPVAPPMDFLAEQRRQKSNSGASPDS